MKFATKYSKKENLLFQELPLQEGCLQSLLCQLLQLLFCTEKSFPVTSPGNDKLSCKVFCGLQKMSCMTVLGTHRDCLHFPLNLVKREGTQGWTNSESTGVPQSGWRSQQMWGTWAVPGIAVTSSAFQNPKKHVTSILKTKIISTDSQQLPNLSSDFGLILEIF